MRERDNLPALSELVPRNPKIIPFVFLGAITLKKVKRTAPKRDFSPSSRAAVWGRSSKSEASSPPGADKHRRTGRTSPFRCLRPLFFRGRVRKGPGRFSDAPLDHAPFDFAQGRRGRQDQAGRGRPFFWFVFFRREKKMAGQEGLESPTPGFGVRIISYLSALISVETKQLIF